MRHARRQCHHGHMTQLIVWLTWHTELLVVSVTPSTVVLLSVASAETAAAPSLATNGRSSWLFMTAATAAVTSSTRLGSSSLGMSLLSSGATITTFGMSIFGRFSVAAVSTLPSITCVDAVSGDASALSSSPSSVMCSSSRRSVGSTVSVSCNKHDS